MRRVAKLIVLGALFGGYMAAGGMLIILIRSKSRLRVAQSVLVSLFSKAMLSTLGVRVIVDAPAAMASMRFVGLVVSNHVSYLDIPVISSAFRSLFVTSLEVRDSGFLGLVCRLGGCLFVNRRSPWKLLDELSELRQMIERGMLVSVFPESTSSDGKSVLSFKPAFFSVAGQGVPVIPVCLNYVRINGLGDTDRLRDEVYYYGDQDFFGQVWKLLSVRSIEVELTLLPLTNDDLKQGDRKSLAEQVHRDISRVFHQKKHRDGGSRIQEWRKRDVPIAF